MATQKMIEIPLEEYLDLQRDSELLDALRVGGVDNWEGWDDAIEAFHDSLHEGDEK